MASIVLSSIGSAVGAPFGPVGSYIGSQLGRFVGSTIDQSLFGSKGRTYNGPRLADLAVQASTYGKMIPIVYGSMRLAGNIIWAQPIRETVTTSRSSAGGGKGGGKATQSANSYNYSATLAVAVCEGEVDNVLRIWADAKQLDTSQYNVRIYKGDEEQEPDSLIQSLEGADNTPAHRGMCYVVFEDFPLADYGNRIPNFTFEVQKKTLSPDYNDETLEEMITGMIMIPGAGEFVYDTEVQYKVPGASIGGDWVQQGSQQCVNMHNASGTANFLLALDQLEDTCPNLEWVSVVACWFGDSTDAGTCLVKPGVEYQSGAVTSPEPWTSAGFTRSTARQITPIGGSPQFGGTPDDNSLLNCIDELKDRGYNVMFYPLLMMDTSGKPWRGDLTGSAGDVADFFTKTNGYNAFITHYANLVAGRVDAFVIGSELKGLTKVTDTPGNYPGVNELVDLAATVKAIVGVDVKVTYAADWSEYHHTDGGWYNLDTLWASDDIDMIGIDAYFPLADAPQSGYNIDAIKDGWTSGEGYDWYYSDPERTIQASLGAAYAWKNLEWFWSHTHTNPDSSTTDWVPESKKIWFTEYGFPSVDGASNQPNVFYDPSSDSSAFPYHSKGRVDFRAQRVGHVATQQQWKDSDMVEQMFAWTWDARPYPYWPDLTSVWSDGPAWKTGHWMQGKLGISSLAAIITEICARAGLEEEDIDVSTIGEQVEGFVISNAQTARDMLESLQLGYFFDSVESDHILKFVPRGNEAVIEIDEDDLVPDKDGQCLAISRAQEMELPRRVSVVYVNRLANYLSATQYSQREVTESRESVTLNLPIVLPDQLAKTVADVTLFSHWVARTGYAFELPVKYACLEPSDIITVTVGGVTHRMRITSTRMSTPAIIRVEAVAEDVSTFDFYTAPGSSAELLASNQSPPTTRLALLDIPAFPGDDTDKGVLRIAACGLADGWKGAAIYRSDDGGSEYGRLSDANAPAAIGAASTALASGPTTVFDRSNSVTVLLVGDAELQNASEIAVLNGANAALIGSEVIQFTTATLVEPGKYTLSGLLRGRLGTEWAIGSHAAGESFVLLDGRAGKQTMAANLLNLARDYKAVTFGSTLADTDEQSFTYSGVALKPYSPVHVTGTRDGSNNLSIAWVRRARIDGGWQDSADVPLNEGSEAYEVDVMDGSDVVRTISGLSTTSASYTAAEQTTDFGSPQSTLAVKIYQLSEIVGRGYAGEVTI